MFSLKSILEASSSIHANPFSLQISKPLVTRGAGGKNEALRYSEIQELTLGDGFKTKALSKTCVDVPALFQFDCPLKS